MEVLSKAIQFSLCTFEEQIPSREKRKGEIGQIISPTGVKIKLAF